MNIRELHFPPVMDHRCNVETTLQIGSPYPIFSIERRGLSSIDNFQASNHRMAGYKKSHRDRVKRVMPGNQQTNQHKRHNHTEAKAIVFFQITKIAG